jgi:dTDP-glucose pyrophosphorylase
MSDYNFKKHIINNQYTIEDALKVIDQYGLIANVLFIVDENSLVIGAVSDGDIRRGLLSGAGLDALVTSVCQRNFKYLFENNYGKKEIEELKSRNIRFAPVINAKKQIIEIIDVHKYRQALPLHAVMMAGGKGQRLLPLTQTTPKPLLIIGDKPIIEHNIDRLASFGIKHITISINYLGEQIEQFFDDGTSKNIKIQYVREKQLLGTIASVKLVERFWQDTVLVMNSDLLTNIDFSAFYDKFIQEDADMAIASTSYHVDVPYAVMEVDGNYEVRSLKEKPRYTYYSNAGIYLLKKELIGLIPGDEFYNVTDLIERLLELDKKVISFPIMGYWLDIGKHDDFKKAQEDIKYLNL